jgi:hypothetical protein
VARVEGNSELIENSGVRKYKFANSFHARLGYSKLLMIISGGKECLEFY